MSARRAANGRAWPVNVILTYLILVGFFVGTRGQQGTAGENWEKFSRLIPTNSVYEQREKNFVSPSPSNPAELHRSLDENNIMDVSKVVTGKNDEREEKETFKDEDEDEYESESEMESESVPASAHMPESESKNLKLAKIRNDTSKKDKSSSTSLADEVEGTSRDEDYLEDPSTSQYDAYYYYDDDYESGNRSRYEAIVDADALDYPDAEEEQEEERATADKESSQSPSENLDSDVESADGPPPSNDKSSFNQEEEVDPDNSTSYFEKGTMAEGNEKTFAFHEPAQNEQVNTSADSPILIGEAVVSVVTTKSVVNGTISVPTTSSPSTTEQLMAPPSSSFSSSSSSSSSSSATPASSFSISSSSPAPPSSASTTEQSAGTITTEDSSRILASVQTSRSISGARFLPFPVVDRVEPIEQSGASEKKTSSAPESTESIIDKLDRVQSELSSGFLAGGFRTAGNTLQLDVLGDRDRGSSNARRRFTTTAKTPVISKFVPRRYNDKRIDHTSTTARPRLETTIDNLKDLLPQDYTAKSTMVTTPGSAKVAFRWPSKSTTSTETSAVKVTGVTTASPKKTKTNAVVQDISAFLPPGYKLKKEDTAVTESSLLSDILAKSKVDISSLLPADYASKKSDATTTAKSIHTTTEKLPQEKSIQDLFAKSHFDISALLPRDYEKKKTDIIVTEKKDPSQSQISTEPTLSATVESISSTTPKVGGLKIVFPSRPGGRKQIHKITTPQSSRGDAAGPATPKIQKGWPTRATTEFTGWPTPSTTPISIEKLLEAARTATVSSVNASLIPVTEATSSTSTTSTTTTTPRPTTPGICEDECEVAGTIRIIGNASWVPELLDRNTHEWQQLANEVEKEMNFIFSKSAVLAKWYKRIRIDSFSEGSILVDYFVELTNLQQRVNTQELRVIFHDTLRMFNTDHVNDTQSKGSMKLGIFTIDPKYSDFVVIPKATTPQYIEKDDRLIPQWAIAVIVIGVGGLLFIIIFGVSVLINRQNDSKKKPSVTTIYEEEVAKNISNHNRSGDYPKPMHTIWTDPDVSWNDKSFESTSNKVLVEKPFQDNKKYNMYDSWRSEWNGYYYNPSHSSSKYGGYDSTTNLSSRHHPDYDTNF